MVPALVVAGAMALLLTVLGCTEGGDSSAADEAVAAAVSTLSVPELPRAADPGDQVTAPTSDTTSTTTTAPAPGTTVDNPDPDGSFDGGYFATNYAVLNADGLQRCAEYGAKLGQRTPGFLTFLGFADSRSTTYPGGNQQLSEDRARTVATCIELTLQKLHIEGYTFRPPRGMGTSCPRVPDDPLDPANRRVEVFIKKTDAEPVLRCPG